MNRSRFLFFEPSGVDCIGAEDSKESSSYCSRAVRMYAHESAAYNGQEAFANANLRHCALWGTAASEFEVLAGLRRHPHACPDQGMHYNSAQ